MNKYNTNLLKYLYETNQFNDLFYDYNRIMTMPLITFAIVNRLFMCSNSENKEFKEFLYAKSDINRTDYYSHEFRENSNILEEKNRSLYNNNVKTPLMYVCESNDIKNIKEIINLKPNINYMNPNNITALHIACKKIGNEPDINKIIELLVDSGADVNIGEKNSFCSCL